MGHYASEILDPEDYPQAKQPETSPTPLGETTNCSSVKRKSKDEILEALAKWMYESEDDALEWADLPEDSRRVCRHNARATIAFLSAAGFGLVADAGAKALEDAADEFESNVGVSEFSDQSVRDDCRWGHIEEAWEYQGPYMDWLRNRAAAVRGEG